jgi:hypothetical protein
MMKRVAPLGGKGSLLTKQSTPTQPPSSVTATGLAEHGVDPGFVQPLRLYCCSCWCSLTNPYLQL